MCVGSAKAPQVSAAPPPSPVPVPTDVAPQQTADQKNMRIKALQFGALSTIKTSPLGVTGSGSDLNKPVGTALKTTTGS